MNKVTFALLGAAALALGGCGSSNQDQVDNAVMNQPNPDQLNDLAANAANDAANAPEPVAKKSDENASAPADNTTNPTDDQEQNVSGM